MKIYRKIYALYQTSFFKWCCAIFLFLVGCLAVFSFVKTPFTGDVKVFMAAAYTVIGKGAFMITYSTPNSEAWVMLPDTESVEYAKKLINEALEEK